jgi:molybdopterin molybdotransferase
MPPTSLPSFEQARRIVEQQAALAASTGTLAPEEISLLQAAGRVLAEDIAADRDLPPFPRSTRDGYALRAADAANPGARLTVAGEIRAGQTSDLPAIAPGQCVEIMTGAPLPPEADAVVMLEYVERQGDCALIQRSVHAGENFVPSGAEARAGQPLLRRGTRLTPSAIAVAASIGHAQLSVFPKPRVAILATGDELVDVTEHPGQAQIRNSNSYSLAAQVSLACGEPSVLPVAPDRHDLLHAAIEQALSADLLLLTGGVSVGRYDLVKQLLAELGSEFFLRGAAIQPGKPIVFGRIPVPREASTARTCHGDTEARRTTNRVPAPCLSASVEDSQLAAPAGWRYFFGLPGNPVSTMVTFELFVRPLLDTLCGALPQPLRFSKARLRAGIHTATGLTRFLPARLSGEFGEVEVELIRWQGSGDVAATALADCLLVVPPDRDMFATGETVNIWRWNR